MSVLEVMMTRSERGLLNTRHGNRLGKRVSKAIVTRNSELPSVENNANLGKGFGLRVENKFHDVHVTKFSSKDWDRDVCRTAKNCVRCIFEHNFWKTCRLWSGSFAMRLWRKWCVSITSMRIELRRSRLWILSKNHGPLTLILLACHTLWRKDTWSARIHDVCYLDISVVERIRHRKIDCDRGASILHCSKRWWSDRRDYDPRHETENKKKSVFPR